jgi:hypothetical protein
MSSRSIEKGETMRSEKLVRIQAVAILEGFKVRLTFSNRTRKEIDLEPFLRGPIFERVRNDPKMFRSVHVDTRAGTIAWDNGADIDPDVLYLGLKPAWMEMEKENAQSKAA